MKVLTVAVVGLGRIGMGYDYDSPAGSEVLSHATAFSTCSGIDLVAGVDPDASKRAAFESKFRKPAYPTIEALHELVRPDVVTVAVPTHLHAPTVMSILQSRPKAVLCEKPLATTVDDGELMVKTAKEAGTVLAVNYIRHFEPGTQELCRRLATGILGDVYKGVIWYTKGLQNNGSHLIDLLQSCLGIPRVVECTVPGRTLPDSDAEPDVHLGFEACDVYLLAGRQECFARAEMELWTTRGVVRYQQGGEIIEWAGTQSDPMLGNSLGLGHDVEKIPTDFDHYQRYVAESLYRHLVEGAPLVSSGDTALDTLRTVDRIMSQRVTLIPDGW